MDLPSMREPAISKRPMVDGTFAINCKSKLLCWSRDLVRGSVSLASAGALFFTRKLRLARVDVSRASLY
jgi:hypothetical protein